MKKVEINYNPYKMISTVLIDGVDVCKDGHYDKFREFIKNKIPLQTWIEPIPYMDWAGFVNEISDPEINDEVMVIFSGRVIDFEDLKRSIADQNNKRASPVIYHYPKTAPADVFPKTAPADPIGRTMPADILPQLRLVGTEGVFAGRRFALEGTLRLGRLPDQNDLVFPADTTGVSGRHCVVRLTNGGATLTDLGSSFGTFLSDGTRLQPNQAVELKVGDSFTLGSQKQRFTLESKS